MPDDTEPPRKSYLLKQRDIVRVNDPAHVGTPDPNDVRTMLGGNLTAANKAGLNEVKVPTRRASRRKRDYILALIAGNLFFGFGTVVSPVFGGAGLILYNSGLTWVMWVVVDDY